MATNSQRGADDGCVHDPQVLGDRACSEDPLACHLAEALEHAETDAARYHLREALQLRLAEDR